MDFSEDLYPMKKTAIVAILILLFFSCKTDNDSGIPCTEDPIAALNITLIDASTEEIISKNVEVVASDGDYTETLELVGGVTPVFVGAWERPGTYILSVSAQGYLPYTSDEITTTANECHVIPVFMEVLLQPE